MVQTELSWLRVPGNPREEAEAGKVLQKCFRAPEPCLGLFLGWSRGSSSTYPSAEASACFIFQRKKKKMYDFIKEEKKPGHRWFIVFVYMNEKVRLHISYLCGY